MPRPENGPLHDVLVVDLSRALAGTLTIPGPPLRFFAPDGSETSPTGHGAPPVLDQHGDALRAELTDQGADA